VQPSVSRYTRVISFDWPHDPPFPSTTRAEVEFVRDLAAEYDTPPPYVVVGHSMGAKTALLARTMYPREVVAALAIDPAPWSALTEADAEPSAEYTKDHPSAAARIRAARASWLAGDFDVKALRADDMVCAHLDVVPDDAPPEVQSRNREGLAKHEGDFGRKVWHWGAGHAIQVTDPRTIIADILRYVEPLASRGDPGLVAPRSRPRPRDGARAVVGGVDYAVGGWGEYEIGRRRARWEATGGGKTGVSRLPGAARADPAERPGACYGGRTYIHADDAVRSVVGARARRGQSVLQRAALRLADALGALEDRLCDPDDDGVWECAPATALRPVSTLRKARLAGEAPRAQYLTIPPVTSADLRAFAADPAQEGDPLALQELSVDVRAAAAAVGADLPPLPALAARHTALPTRAVAVTDDEAVLRLEAAVAPYVASLEALQAALATQLDTAATAIARAAAKSRATGGAAATRGEEVDAAAKHPPLALLKAGLPWRAGARAFDLRGDAAAPTEPSDGIYLGVAGRGDPARATLLTPHLAAVAAFKTSGRMYAWYVLDSPEGCYALRAPPRDGYAVKLDADAIVAWLKPRLTGSPPHKIAATEYLAHLRSLGLEVREGPRRGDGSVRFDLVDATTAAERARELAALRALTRADFAALDWAAYDREAAGEACRTTHEVAGDVAVDLAARTVAAPKVRPGTLWGARTHYRSYVTFHTHPAARYRGSRAEPPSPTDVLLTLEACALDMQAWAFVSAPEGTYIMRPSQALAAAFLRDPQEVADTVSGLYTEGVRACVGTTAACGADAVRALEEAGFVAHLRGEPCTPLLPVPDLFPTWNRESREESRAAYAALAETPAETLLAADWAPAAAEGESPTVRAATWLTAGLSEGRAVPSGEGHGLGPADEPGSYPSGVPGPLLVVYFPDEEGFPARVPHAALKAARKNAALWAWVVFLSPSRVSVFRAGPAGVEIHGPAPRRDGAAPAP